MTASLVNTIDARKPLSLARRSGAGDASGRLRTYSKQLRQHVRQDLANAAQSLSVFVAASSVVPGLHDRKRRRGRCANQCGKTAP